MDAARDMATFQVLARTGTISAAAHELGVAPSAVSRRLKALEARLGIELVRRSTRAMVLTPAGEAYLARSKDLLKSIDALEEEMRDESLGVAGPIRMAAPLSFGLCALPDPLDAFLKAHPAISLEMDLRDDQVDLVREGFDLALRIGELPPSTLIAKKLTSIPFAVGASPEFLEKHGPIEKPEQLDGLPGLVYANALRGDVLNWTNEDGSEGRAQLTRTLVANNGDILAALAAKGHGIYAAPRFILAGQLNRGELLPVLPDVGWPETALHAVWPPTDHLPARVRALIDSLAAHFSGLPRR
ncbi:LysR family transcriptional regulator [Parvularcula sp. ZS-1/3]|uniref:LysR family transcriptional regulator n=1 Tax=Parvularcula mediterranea TaxID=2732508 RepID=A0A7Y3W4U3_9PROT|nr:LysR family transcriptional regulator [Parvularcula mediterranea]NNU15561.1 LysR family transcriptional regulator [Parvularcula mediterranea]